MYSKMIDLRQINAAGASIIDTRLLVRRKGIFVQPRLVDVLKNALDVLGKAQVERYIHFQHGTTGIGYAETSRLLSEGDKIFDSLQSSVRDRLIGVQK